MARQLIDVRLHLADRPDCVVVPSQAVQVGQQGPYVYVVKQDQSVEYRLVTPGMLHQGETVVEAGLQAGERVVTDGQMQLIDGARIEERGQAATRPEGKGAEADGARGKK